MSDYSEHLISMAGGGEDPLDAIQRRAEKFIAAHDEMLRIGQGVGGLAVERPDLTPDFDAWWFESDVEHADTALELLTTIRTQQATLDAVLNLANTSGRCGWRISADELRRTLRGES